MTYRQSTCHHSVSSIATRMLPALLLLLSTVTMTIEHEKPYHHDEKLDHHDEKPEPSCMMVEEITTCKIEAIDVETEECLYQPVICLTEVKVCSTELVEREACQDRQKSRLGKRQIGFPIYPKRLPVPTVGILPTLPPT